MPADRRITVQIQAPGMRNEHGRFVPGAVTALGVWASRRDVSQELKVERGGTRDETTRDWRIRWNSLIASSTTANLEVIDGAETFTINNMVEVTRRRGEVNLRRRFLDLQGIRG